MKIPIHFPNEAEALAAEAAAFRQLTSEERLQAIFDLIASGMALLADSPHRQAMLRLQEESEAEWRRAQKELIARHGHRA